MQTKTAATTHTIYSPSFSPSSPLNEQNNKMSTSREGPNPLRPYYIPPSIGIPQDVPVSTNTGTHGVGLKNGSAASYASSARDIFSDIDYSDYLSDTSPSTIESLQKLINETFTNYAGILCAQPFEVAKTVLQVKSQDPLDGTIPTATAESMRKRPSGYRDSLYNEVWFSTLYKEKWRG